MTRQTLRHRRALERAERRAKAAQDRFARTRSDTARQRMRDAVLEALKAWNRVSSGAAR
jgi:dephospho-CoA kinase